MDRMPKQRPGAHFVMGARPLPKHLRWGNRKTMHAIYDVALFGQDFVHRSPQSRPSSGLYQEVGRHLWHGVGHGRGKGEWKTYPGRDKFWETHGIPHYTNLLRAHLGCVPSFCFVESTRKRTLSNVRIFQVNCFFISMSSPMIFSFILNM